MPPNRGWILVNGQLPTWHKSVQGLNDVLRQAGAAATLDELDAATEAFREACEAGRLLGVEAELGVRALGRALRRLDGGGPLSGAESGEAAEGKADVSRVRHSGGIEYGAAISGVKVLR